MPCVVPPPVYTSLAVHQSHVQRHADDTCLMQHRILHDIEALHHNPWCSLVCTRKTPNSHQNPPIFFTRPRRGFGKFWVFQW